MKAHAPLIIFASFVAALLVTAGVLVAVWPVEKIARYLPPCETEDSTTSCYWDAATRGNGQGDSFVIVDGTTYYLGR